MTTEVYQMTLEEIVGGQDPVEIGRNPLFTVEPGNLSDVALVQITQNDSKRTLALYCEKDNSDTKLYKVNRRAYLTSYGRKGMKRLLLQDSEEDTKFAFRHEFTVFPNFPVPMMVEDGVGKRGWLLLVHKR